MARTHERSRESGGIAERMVAGTKEWPPLAPPLTPVLVLDEAERGDLGLVRSLGIAGIPIHLVTSRPGGATAASRYVTRVHAFPPPHVPIEEQLAALRGIAAGVGGRPPVMMAGDRTLELVSDHRGDLADVLCHDLPAPHVVQTCFHKDRFAVEAMRLGLPAPQTNVAASAEAAAALAPHLMYPVFVKPFTKKAWGQLPQGVVDEPKGERVDRPEELLALFRRLEPFGADAALIQHLVSSPDSEHYSVHAYVSPEGMLLGAFTTRKIRVCPPHRGTGSCVRSEVIPELVEAAHSVLTRLGYTGFALVQFKRDLESGRYLLLEINCRFSTSGELTARCGANFPAVSYAILTGQAPPPVQQREGPSWLDLERDVAAMRLYRSVGEWTWTGFVRSLSSVRYFAHWAVDDPNPFIRVTRDRIRRRLRRWRGKLPAADEKPAPSQPAQTDDAATLPRDR